MTRNSFTPTKPKDKRLFRKDLRSRKHQVSSMPMVKEKIHQHRNDLHLLFFLLWLVVDLHLVSSMLMDFLNQPQPRQFFHPL